MFSFTHVNICLFGFFKYMHDIVNFKFIFKHFLYLDHKHVSHTCIVACFIVCRKYSKKKTRKTVMLFIEIQYQVI